MANGSLRNEKERINLAAFREVEESVGKLPIEVFGALSTEVFDLYLFGITWSRRDLFHLCIVIYIESEFSFTNMIYTTLEYIEITPRRPQTGQNVGEEKKEMNRRRSASLSTVSYSQSALLLLSRY